jgi:alpha-aminoadipate carrier protein LysW
MVNCPLCDAVIDVDEDELDEGDSLICEECGSNLSVGGTNPLELTPEVDASDDEEEELDDEDFEEEDDEAEEEEEEEDEWE